MQVCRTRGSLVAGWLTAGVGLLLGAGGVMAATQGSARQGIGLGACVALIGVAAYLRPAVVVSGDAVTFKNVFHTAVVPLSRIAEISARWSLEVRGDDGMAMGSFAAPTTRAARSDERSRNRVQETLADQEAHSPSRPAAMIYDAWQEWKTAHGDAPPHKGQSPSVTKRLDPMGLGLVLVGVAMGAVGLFG
ncbi:PH domain-containing protein [Demequina lutea]|uniref:PH domain-containing protein n=1 Tax=Demequina lutea TaxID=431489 RepID=A0A7Z0CI78_9MICO|nr:PH domain-containing protein [Demequina lutea]NYI42271.1 hypothetical protein [Demequina lutea]